MKQYVATYLACLLIFVVTAVMAGAWLGIALLFARRMAGL